MKAIKNEKLRQFNGFSHSSKKTIYCSNVDSAHEAQTSLLSTLLSIAAVSPQY